MKKHSVFLPRLIFPLLCRVFFLYPFQLLWRSGRLQGVNRTRANQRKRTDQDLSLIGLDHDMILPWPNMSVSLITGEQRGMMQLRRKFIFSPGQRQVPVRPIKNISRTLKYFGRMCDQIGRTLEPWHMFSNSKKIVWIIVISILTKIIVIYYFSHDRGLVCLSFPSVPPSSGDLRGSPFLGHSVTADYDVACFQVALN